MTFAITESALDHLMNNMMNVLIECIYNRNDLNILFEIQRIPEPLKNYFADCFAQMFNEVTDSVFSEETYEIMTRLIESMDTAIHVFFRTNRERAVTKDELYDAFVCALYDLTDIRESGAALFKCYLRLEY